MKYRLRDHYIIHSNGPMEAANMNNEVDDGLIACEL